MMFTHVSLPILISVLVISVICSPQLIKLKDFSGNTTINATGSFSVYVSASSDSDKSLKNVYLQVPGEPKISLYQLKHNKMNPSSGLLQPYRVNTKKQASIVSPLTNSEMAKLQGFLYLTTARQMNDNAFYVYDIDQEQSIIFDQTKFENCTIVFLNSNTTAQSAIISEWVQSENSTVSIYHDIPKNSREKNLSQIFSNPVYVTKKLRYISNVEPFTLSLPAFYIKSSGGIQFKISPGYYEIAGTTTTAPTTTGFYMKPLNRPDVNVTVNILTINTLVEDKSPKMCGCNIIGSMMPNKSSVSFVESSLGGPTNGYSVTPTDQILGWSTPYSGNTLTISSQSASNGQFFLQYYVIYGDL
uniref:CUB-like domain-containing protein n=1 Tax=Caenorhabditis japonica TaxID=281687 RepID=A0A8R1DK03_CAEJA